MIHKRIPDPAERVVCAIDLGEEALEGVVRWHESRCGSRRFLAAIQCGALDALFIHGKLSF